MSTDEFVLAVMDLDGVTVGRDDDMVNVTCRDHDGVDEIETKPIHVLAAKHGMWITNTIGDFSAGELRFEIIEEDSSGDWDE